ncbi:MAG: SRPBCC family protein [Actinomycetota bacterium]|nr:SRPBCC family protein [Actinomycetota bacterium]
MIEHSVVIRRPLEDVWTYVTDPANNPVWQGPVTEVRSGTGVPVAVGSEIAEVMHFLGRRIEVTWAVTEYEPMQRSAVRTISGPVPMHGSYRFERVDGGTRFTLGAEMQAHGLFKLAEPVFARMVDREGASSCEVLKELLESETTTGTR